MNAFQNYVGLDAHSKNCFFVVMNKFGKVTGRIKVATTESAILGFVGSLKGSVALTCEEGALSQWLYVLLVDKVDCLVVCHPADNVKRPGPKTDFRDAAELADLLRVNRLTPVFHSTDKKIELRTLISGYDDLIAEIVRAKNRYKALFRLCGTVASGPAIYNDKEAIKGLSTRCQRMVGKSLFEQIEMLENQKELFKKEFERNRRKFKAISLLCSIPGFGVVRANQVVAIVVTPCRFPTKYDYFSYAMLIKHNQMSDGTLYGCRKIHARSSLRAVYRSAALSAVRSDNALSRKYTRMQLVGCTEKAARRAIARALAAISLGVWKTGKEYNDELLEERIRKGERQKRG